MLFSYDSGVLMCDYIIFLLFFGLYPCSNRLILVSVLGLIVLEYCCFWLERGWRWQNSDLFSPSRSAVLHLHYVIGSADLGKSGTKSAQDRPKTAQ